MKIPKDLIDDYPPTRENQCTHWKSICPECGVRFPKLATVCECGAKRERCRNVCMDGEDSCRVHMRGRTYNIFTVAAQNFADSALENMIERDDRDLAQEYQLARALIAQELDPDKLGTGGVDGIKLMKMLSMFFDIADKRKKIESGETLNVQIGDEARRFIQQRMKSFVGAIDQTLKEFFPEQESLRLQILERVRELASLPGNEKTIVPMLNGKKAKQST